MVIGPIGGVKAPTILALGVPRDDEFVRVIDKAIYFGGKAIHHIALHNAVIGIATAYFAQISNILGGKFFGVFPTHHFDEAFVALRRDAWVEGDEVGCFLHGLGTAAGSHRIRFAQSIAQQIGRFLHHIRHFFQKTHVNTPCRCWLQVTSYRWWCNATCNL